MKGLFIMRKIYARNTQVERIENNQSQEFVEINHSQGSAKGTFKKESIGIFFANELVGVAQFCSPRTSGKKKLYSVELLRLCFKKDTQIIGGASKLIKHYIEKYNPSDIFTYQDSTGLNTDVYEKSGFKLVKQNKEKRYFVAPGKSLKTADRKNKEVFSIAYVSSYGPDNLLKTDIGEQFHSDGKRKTNIELFEELGWHIEETTGDKIYEWINPNLSFYTYKITAIDSDKYYYGVSSIKKSFSHLTIEDCINDGYFGSGGNTLKNNKFQNWKKKHKNYLKKDIINIFDRKNNAYNAEKELIGDLWKTDNLCLNSTNGGVYTGFNKGWRENVFEKECSIHGLTKHRGNACYKCFMNDLVSVQVCEIHGETKFQGESCSKCAVGKTFTKKICPKHGETTFSGVHCRKCSVEKTVQMKECSIHGFTKHQGNVCNSCNALSSISLKVCEIHGETKFTGDRCRKCISAKNNVKKECPIHGLSSHRGKSCVTCTSQKTAHKKYHLNNKNLDCFVCRQENSIDADSIVNPIV